MTNTNKTSIALDKKKETFAQSVFFLASERLQSQDEFGNLSVHCLKRTNLSNGKCLTSDLKFELKSPSRGFNGLESAASVTINVSFENSHQNRMTVGELTVKNDQ